MRDTGSSGETKRGQTPIGERAESSADHRLAVWEGWECGRQRVAMGGAQACTATL